MRRVAQFLIIPVFLLFISGCSSSSSQSSGSTNSASGSDPAEVPVSLTVTDTPPAGVTVLFFQLSITGASLSTAGGSVSSLIGAAPIPINVSQLQTESAFLSSANVAAGTYASLSLSFANPQLTIFNGSGAAIGSCANNTVCQLTPTLTAPTSLTFSTAPFPVTVAANSPLAFMLDIHLDTVIQSNLSVGLAATNGVTISLLPTPPSGAPVVPLGNLTGTIQSLVANGFVLQTADGRTFNIGVNSSTIYDYPTPVCLADNYSCLATQQIVQVQWSLQTGGTLLASGVRYVQPPGQSVVEGNIIHLETSGSSTLMDLILEQGPPMPAANVIPLGQRVTVTVPSSGVTYAIDSHGFTIPGGLSFAKASDLTVGQQVSVVVQGAVTTATGSTTSLPIVAPAAITFTTNSITLEPSQITGSVAAINESALSFTLSTLPNYFVPPTATTAAAPPIPAPVNITVQTTLATTFTNFTPDTISGLYVNDVVSVEGWLFQSGVTPLVCGAGTGCPPNLTLAADTVLARPGPTPLF